MSKENKHAKAKGILIGINLTLIVGLATFPTLNANIKTKASKMYNSNLLDSYNKHLNDYAKEFDLNTMEDIDVFMKIMDDINKEYTYKKVEDIPYGYERLFIYDNHFGDCSNMADDMTAKLNKLNSSYNARNIDVKMETNEVTCINAYDCFLEKNNLKPNHTVTLVDVGDKTLLLDPANQAIGTIKDGKIVMFDTDIKMHLTPVFTYLKKGYKDTFSVLNDINKSHKEIDIETLKNQYGIESQIKAKQKLKK